MYEKYLVELYSHKCEGPEAEWTRLFKKANVVEEVFSGDGHALPEGQQIASSSQLLQGVPPLQRATLH